MRLITGYGPAAGLSVIAVSAVHGMPWWGYLVAVLACSFIYICRLTVVLLLGSKALDKALPEHASAIMDAVTGHRPGADRPSSSERTKSSPEATLEAPSPADAARCAQCGRSHQEQSSLSTNTGMRPRS